MDHCYFKYLFYRYLNCRDRSCSIQTFDWSHVKKNYAERNTRNADTRKLLASYILLSLEVLVVADIIESVIKPTWTDILKLALIIIIRTVISYFLNQEIEDKENKEEEVG